MNPNSPIYSVVHLRLKYIGEGLQSQETIASRWFGSFLKSEEFFMELTLAPIVYTLEDGVMVTIRESKRIYDFGLGETAKALIVNEPKYDAEKLAYDLKLDPTAGILCDHELPPIARPISN
jgi:hypothetical protein